MGTCVYLLICMCTSGIQVLEEVKRGNGFLGTGDTDSCEPPNVSAGKQTPL